MAKDTLHVVPHEDSWWVKREGNERASSTHATQKEAIDAARSLAREGDDIIIHRPDGTIRERFTYTGSANGNGGSEQGTSRSSRREVGIEDVAPVGSRVSWSAVFAGVAVAGALCTLLSLLALAVGVSTVDHVRGRTFNITAAVIQALILLGSLFLGGYVASRMTTRETTQEAAIYGVLVWAALVFGMLLTGSNLGGNLGSLAQVGRDQGVATSPDAQRRADDVRARAEQTASEVNSTAAAWWTFGAVALSMLSAIGGSLVGAGPEIGLRRRVAVERPATGGAVAVQPA